MHKWPHYLHVEAEWTAGESLLAEVNVQQVQTLRRRRKLDSVLAVLVIHHARVRGLHVKASKLKQYSTNAMQER